MTGFKSRRSGIVAFRKPRDRVPEEPRQIEDTDTDSADLHRLVGSVWRRKWLILCTTLGMAVLFFVATAFQQEQFTARATIMLDPREQKFIESQDQVVADLSLNQAILESEVAILRSSSLLETVVIQTGIDRFNGIDPANTKPGLLARAITTIKGLLPSPTPADDLAAPLISPEQRRLNRILGKLREGISVTRLGDSYVIQIVVVTPDPELSAIVANTLATTYIAAQLQNRQRVAESATRWLSDQVEDRRALLETAETQVEDYKRSQLDATGTSLTAVEQQLAEINQQLALARSDRATEEARLQQIETMVTERGASAVAETSDSSFLGSLRGERERLLSEDARLAATHGANHPDRLNLKRELVRLNQLMTDEVSNIAQTHRNEIFVLQTREASLTRDVETLEAKLAEISTSSLRLRQLEREADAARESFEVLLGRLGQTRAQVEIQRAEAKLINRAQIPAGPSAPRPVLLTAFGATLGMTGGLIIALMVELMGTGFSQSGELERATGLRVLTTLPRARLRSPRKVLSLLDTSSYSLFAERVRQLRTMISFSALRQGRSVLMLSSLPGEGKTTTALALAHYYTRAGFSTVVLDLDTRRSALMSEIGAAPDIDLSDYLAGTATLDDLQFRPGGVGFDVLGTQRSKALFADDVSDSRISNLITELKRRYDVVLIDAPPVLAVSDGISIAPFADQILYLVRWRKTSRKSVAYGLAMLENIGVRPTGLILTLADTSADPDGYAKDYTYS